MGVHARPVVAEQWFGHERSGAAVRPRHVLDDVLEQHQLVAGVLQGVEPVVDLRLAGCADLMVGPLHLDAHRGEREDHRIAQVSEVVGGRDREVATLVAGLVSPVAAVLTAAGVPRGFDGVDEVVASVLLGLKTDVVEDVELRLRTEVGRVRDAGAGQVGLRLGGHVSRVTTVGLVGERVDDGEVHRERLLTPERVDEGGLRVGDELHVRLVDRLEAADRRPVEHQPLGEHVGVERLGGGGEVLHHTRQVAEAHVHELHALVADVAQDLVSVAEHASSSPAALAGRPEVVVRVERLWWVRRGRCAPGLSYDMLAGHVER